jgi:uncharacterized protein YqjF (DUF2071 family)
MNKNGSPELQRSIWSHLLCVKITLRDVIYVTYALPAKILRPLVPDALQLETVSNNIAFISLVALKSTRTRLVSLPFFRFNYNQFNIRTYVVDPISGNPAVYFIRSGVTSRLISLATNSMGIPWEHIEFTIALSGSKENMSANIAGEWEGSFSLKVRSAADSLKAPSFFQDRKSAIDFLIRPLIGFSGGRRRLVRFNIRHPEVQVESWVLKELDCPQITRLAAFERNQPHSVFFLPEADFSIYLPPKRIKSKR